MILSFHPCLEADANVILGSRRINADDLDLIRQADAVILPQGRPDEIYRACSGSSAILFPNYDARFRYPGKIGQSILFKELDFTHPETQIWRTVEEYQDTYPDFKSLPHKVPFFIKDDTRHEAEGVFLVQDPGSLLSALEFLQKREASGSWGFVTQELIPSDGNVLRTVIIGDRIISYWKRPSAPGEIITTISRGAIVDHQWRPDLMEEGERAVRHLAMKTKINLAAADLVFPVSEKTSAPLFLEINYYFGRQGLGGSENYYRILYQAVRDWLKREGFDPDAVKLV